MPYYKAYNLIINSELEFPFMPTINRSKHDSSQEICITYGDVAEDGLINPLKKSLYYHVSQDHFWLFIPHIARILVSNGNQILIDAFPNVSSNDLFTFLFDTCIAALLMQRGLFPYHGNILKIGSTGIAFLGAPGVGKSTLTAAFMRRGYKVVADKLCVIDQQGNGLPGIAQMDLWPHMALYNGLEIKNLQPVRAPISKLRIPFRESYHSESLPIELIYNLKIMPYEKAQFIPLTGGDKLENLQQKIYKRSILDSCNITPSLMQSLSLSNRFNIINFQRPQIEVNVEMLVDSIEKDLNKRGLFACA